MIVTKLKVRLYGDPVLRKKSLPVNEVGPSERLLIHSMVAAMHQHKGIGLAAPQVGINKRIFVIDIGEGPQAFINPKILKRSGEDVMEEGCLSIPQVNVQVKRAKKILVKYLDENNEWQEKVFEDLLARVVLHETDHLDGKLIVDYASKEEKKKFEPVLKKLEETQEE